MNFARRSLGTNVVPELLLTPGLSTASKITDGEAAKSFALLVGDFSSRQLATASGRTIEAAKKWKSGKQSPSAASLLNMAAALPCVQLWLNENAEHLREAQARSIDGVIRAMRKLKDQPGPEGDTIRRLLAEIAGEGGR
jgi:hypothetical protein